MADAVAPVIVHVSAANGFYGGPRVVSNICRLLPQAKIFVLCMTGNIQAMSPFRDEVEKTGEGRFICQDKSVARAFLKLLQISRTTNRMVIHAHGYKETFVACLFGIFASCRIVVTQHGFTARNRKMRFYNFIDKFCCRFGRVHRVICVSRKIEAIYRNFGVASSRLLYLPNGTYPIEIVNYEQRVAARRQLAKRLGIREDLPVVLFAGRLSGEKDPLLFVAVVEELRQHLRGLCGVIAGDGPLCQEVEKKVQSMGLSENVRMLGFVSNLNELLAGADVLLLTSNTEGMPMVVLEAMSVGTPVVSAHVGDVGELVRPGQNGFLVKTRQPIDFARQCLTIFENPVFRQEAFHHCQQTVKRAFSMQRQLDVYKQLYGL